jgi:hypothetical protein
LGLRNLGIWQHRSHWWWWQEQFSRNNWVKTWLVCIWQYCKIFPSLRIIFSAFQFVIFQCLGASE